MAVKRQATSAVLVGLALPGDAGSSDDSLRELSDLATSAGVRVAAAIIQAREAPDPRTFIGRGKTAEVSRAAAESGSSVIIFDQELSPAQQGHLEDECGIMVMDRTGLILDIFAQRARTREGKLQVEIAQLEYLLPRLVGRHRELSRLGGGIGTRGPGEKKLEMDRRRIKRAIARLNLDMEGVERQRNLYRQARRRSRLPIASLVGYTSSGKSTLLNSLTGAGVLAEARLFSTLDPTTRRLRLPGGGTALISDTVGFIRHLPVQLIAAFRSTLEEVRLADILIHVIDISRSDYEEQIQAVRDCLADIGAADKPVIEIFNKVDLMRDPIWLFKFRRRRPEAVFVSALLGTGLAQLLNRLETMLRGRPHGEKRA